MCDPILVTLLKMWPMIVTLVVIMRPHPAAHPHQPLIRKNNPPPPSPGSSPIVLALGECRWDSTKQVLVPFYVVLWIVCKSNAHDATLKTEDILSRVPDARTQNHTSFMHQVAQQIISPWENLFAKRSSFTRKSLQHVPQCVLTLQEFVSQWNSRYTKETFR